MTRIVTTHYRYKRPPRKRKAVAIDGPAIVTVESRRRLSLGGRGCGRGSGTARHHNGSAGIVTLTFVRQPEVGDASTLLRTSLCVSDACVLLPDTERLSPERAICRGRQ